MVDVLLLGPLGPVSHSELDRFLQNHTTFNRPLFLDRFDCYACLPRRIYGVCLE
jgi:hypothetical protein